MGNSTFNCRTICNSIRSYDESTEFTNEYESNELNDNLKLSKIQSNDIELSCNPYERSLINPTTTEVIPSKDLTNELFKDTYVFDFLDKEKIKTEKDLKNQMIDNIIKFLQELGPGFTLAGKEYK